MKTVLVAAQKRLISRMVRDALENEGYAVAVAEQADDLLDRLHLADLVVIDSGFPLLRDQPPFWATNLYAAMADIPIVLMVARGRESAVDSVRAGPCDAILRKPFTTKELVHLVDGGLRGVPSGTLAPEWSVSARARRAAQSGAAGGAPSAPHLAPAVPPLTPAAPPAPPGVPLPGPGTGPLRRPKDLPPEPMEGPPPVPAPLKPPPLVRVGRDAKPLPTGDQP